MWASVRVVQRSKASTRAEGPTAAVCAHFCRRRRRRLRAASSCWHGEARGRRGARLLEEEEEGDDDDGEPFARRHFIARAARGAVGPATSSPKAQRVAARGGRCSRATLRRSARRRASPRRRSPRRWALDARAPPSVKKVDRYDGAATTSTPSAARARLRTTPALLRWRGAWFDCKPRRAGRGARRSLTPLASRLRGFSPPQRARASSRTRVLGRLAERRTTTRRVPRRLLAQWRRRAGWDRHGGCGWWSCTASSATRLPCAGPTPREGLGAKKNGARRRRASLRRFDRAPPLARRGGAIGELTPTAARCH